jgi:hypothetical protein
LRHEGDVLADGRQVAEIDEIEGLAFESDAQLFPALVWDLAQELVEYPELVHQLSGRRMDGVPAKVAEEVTVLFHDEGRHTRPREQIAEHHPSRSATRPRGRWSSILPSELLVHGQRDKQRTNSKLNRRTASAVK